MSIRRWHWGRIVILWAWGGVIAGLLLASFISSPVDQSPFTSALTLLISLLILIGLSVTTWQWLGKDQ